MRYLSYKSIIVLREGERIHRAHGDEITRLRNAHSDNTLVMYWRRVIETACLTAHEATSAANRIDHGRIVALELPIRHGAMSTEHSKAFKCALAATCKLSPFNI